MNREDLHFLLAEFMNLVDACRDHGVQFEEGYPGLEAYTEIINDFLRELGYDKETIAKMWTGEVQLSSS